MDKRSIIAIICFFVLLVAGMFVFAFMKKSEITEEQQVQQTDSEPEPAVEYASITRIDGKHYFIDGVHTVVGEIPMPTPCDLVEVNTEVEESSSETVVLNFNVINNADYCAQVVTPQRFSASAQASEEANFSANFMGREVQLNLIPALPGETPEEFELFIKG